MTRKTMFRITEMLSHIFFISPTGRLQSTLMKFTHLLGHLAPVVLQQDLHIGERDALLGHRPVAERQLVALQRRPGLHEGQPPLVDLLLEARIKHLPLGGGGEVLLEEVGLVQRFVGHDEDGGFDAVGVRCGARLFVRMVLECVAECKWPWPVSTVLGLGWFRFGGGVGEQQGR